MHTLFPTMTSCPEGKQITFGALYWVVYLIILPFFINLFTVYAFVTLSSIAIATVIFLLINFFCLGVTFKEYLQDSWLFASLHVNEFWKTVGIAAGIIILSQLPIQLCIALFYHSTEFLGGTEWILTFFLFPPFVDMIGMIGSPILSPETGAWLTLLSVVCTIAIPPLTMSCMYYAVVFAPVCQKRVWLAYVLVLIIGLIVPVSYYRDSGSWALCIATYLSRLPLYLGACWAYQKTDNIWAPIAVHGIVNLLFMLPLLIISIAGLFA